MEALTEGVQTEQVRFTAIRRTIDSPLTEGVQTDQGAEEDEEVWGETPQVSTMHLQSFRKA